MRSRDETSPEELALQQGKLRPEQLPNLDGDFAAGRPENGPDGRDPHEGEGAPENLGISRGAGGPADTARGAEHGRGQRATTEYGANAEAPEGGQGYVKGADLPTEGRDDAPQG